MKPCENPGVFNPKYIFMVEGGDVRGYTFVANDVEICAACSRDRSKLSNLLENIDGLEAHVKTLCEEPIESIKVGFVPIERLN
jgi:hypothetical protein